MEWWIIFKDWFLSLGSGYHVNPFIFGAIYIGAIPFFFLFLKQTISKMRKKQPFFIPLLLTGMSFVSAYIYLIIAGKDIPVWVYIFIALMIIYGIYSIIKKINKSLKPGKK